MPGNNRRLTHVPSYCYKDKLRVTKTNIMGLEFSGLLIFTPSSAVWKIKIHQAPRIILNQFLRDSFKSPYQMECFYTARHKQTNKKVPMKGISISK